LGGADSVRAFTVSDFSADKAAFLSAEWYAEFPMTWLAEAIEDKLKVALFVDGAYGSDIVSLDGTNDIWANLAGAGLLFKFTWRERLGTIISFATPMTSKSSEISDLGDNSDSVQTYVEVTYSFD
jgi:hemolysin activation/secretion protein